MYLGPLLKSKEPEKEERDAEETPHRPAVLISADELKRYAGVYVSDELGVTYRLEMSETALKFASIFASGSFPRSTEFAGKTLIPVGKDLFEIPDEYMTIAFRRDSSGVPSTIVLDAGRTRGIIFHRTGAVP
jgi:hypothetical protein